MMPAIVRAARRAVGAPRRSVILPGSILLAAGLTGCAEPFPAGAQTAEDHAFRIDTVATGLEHPWGMAFLPEGDILVTERPGRLRIVRAGALDPRPIGGVPAVWARGQGGLLDVTLHPDFARNRLVYLSFSKPEGDRATTAVIRGRLDGQRLADVEEILEADAWSTRGQHFGSRMVFDRDGYLYVTIGDRGRMERAQDPSDHAGVTLRLGADGSVPGDNPFVGEAGVRPEIFTYGNRSPQGLTVHPVTGELWQAEHGPRGGDEINLIRAGRNYGWPVITYGINYGGDPITDRTEMEGMEQPLHYWDPSIATSGIAIYHGDRFPAWRGDVFVGGLSGQQLARVRFDGHQATGEETLLEGYARIRDVRVGPDGFLYLLTDASDGALVRLVPAD